MCEEQAILWPELLWFVAAYSAGCVAVMIAIAVRYLTHVKPWIDEARKAT